jgi:hypothetical protein
MRYNTDEISDENLLKIIRKFVIHIYGEELSMETNKDGYIRFFSVGPEPPYHRNLSGRLWMDDDRLVNMIKEFLGVNWDEAKSLTSFYFSNTYNIKVTDAKYQSHRPLVIDYSQFDDPNYDVDEDEDW